jgi:hypothetical protein
MTRLMIALASLSLIAGCATSYDRDHVAYRNATEATAGSAPVVTETNTGRSVTETHDGSSYLTTSAGYDSPPSSGPRFHSGYGSRSAFPTYLNSGYGYGGFGYGGYGYGDFGRPASYRN